MALSEKLAALRDAFGKRLKPDIAVAMERHLEELRARLSGAIKAGDPALPFELENQHGERVSLSELLTRGPVVLSFYRGSWCPYCNAELVALDDVADEIRSLGATVVAISPQNRDNSRAFVDQLGLTFDVLHDRANAVAAAYGLGYEFPAYLRELYEGTFRLDIAAINDDATWKLPIPARFVIGTDGAVVDARVDPDYRYRPEPAETVAVLRGMLAGRR